MKNGQRRQLVSAKGDPVVVNTFGSRGGNRLRKGSIKKCARWNAYALWLLGLFRDFALATEMPPGETPERNLAPISHTFNLHGRIKRPVASPSRKGER